MNAALRPVALLSTVLGAIASLTFMFLVGRRNQSSFLMVLFAGWVSLPYLALGFADYFSAAWSKTTRTTLHVLMILLSVVPAVLYGDVFLNRTSSPGAFRFLMVPLGSLAIMTTALVSAALLSRRGADRP